MAQINVTNLTFNYEGSYDNIFEEVSFSIDTNWKLGFIGRNGKGKTTFLKILLGQYEYKGNITNTAYVDYFPYEMTKADEELCGVDLMSKWKADCELWRVLCEMDGLAIGDETLYRPFGTLSYGERTKLMLAVLFSGENDFLLVDEPTNHLDQESREIVKKYLKSKKGFILVSHDRDLLDACVDHVLVLNRQTIEVQKGNFASWWENKSRKDSFSQMENEKHKREIAKLEKAAKRTKQWADKNERSKIGFDPVKEHDRFLDTRAYIGAKTKKMQSRVKVMSQRMDKEIEQKKGLLQDIDRTVELKMWPEEHHKYIVLHAKDYGLRYFDAAAEAFDKLNMEVKRGDRIFLHGENGCGKSSFIHAVLAHADGRSVETDRMTEQGTLDVASGLRISYVNQDTGFLHGSTAAYCEKCGLDESLFHAVLRQLGMERKDFSKPMQEFSEGQKKKVLLAASLLTPAQLYIWDEPLNYLDVFSRMQIEKLLLTYEPTMLIVEHDVRFRQNIATGIVTMMRSNDSHDENMKNESMKNESEGNIIG